MKINLKKQGHVLVILPEEKKIDAMNAVDLKNRILRLVDEGRRYLILNLSKVEFIDSSGLGAMVFVMKSLGKNGGIKLCGLCEGVSSLLALTRLDRVFDVYLSEKDAMDSFPPEITDESP